MSFFCVLSKGELQRCIELYNAQILPGSSVFICFIIWQSYIDEGRFKNVKELARFIGRDSGNVVFAIRTAMLAPKVIHRIMTGNIPDNVTLETLRHPLPEEWDEQYRAIFGEEP